MPLSPTTAAKAETQWPTLSYDRFQTQVERACKDPDYYLDQRQLGTCGPIAVLHALASKAKGDFVKLTDEVYKNPSRIPEDLRTSPDLNRRSDFLAAILATHLLNEENHLLKFHATEGKRDLVAGSSSPGNIKHWIKEFFPEKTIKTYSSYFWGTMDNAKEINALWSHDKPDPIIFAVVNAACLQPTSHLFTHKLPGVLAMAAARGHFIQITSPFHTENDENIQFEAFTWGDTHHYSFTEKEFSRMILEFIVAI
ncbi:MAG: hypothetical protein V4534_04900 [Myxococcota bacterium]